jgi:hypothetical protein
MHSYRNTEVGTVAAFNNDIVMCEVVNPNRIVVTVAVASSSHCSN